MKAWKLTDGCPPISVFSLPTGLSTVVHSFPTSSVGIAFLIKCGPVFETPKNNGISHFLEHMLFRGTPRYPTSEKLAFALDKVGSDTNAATFTDMTILSLRALPESIEEALEILRDMIGDPLLSDVEAEREIILEECLEDIDETGQVVAIDQLSSQLLYGRHPYALPILGTPHNVKNFSHNDFRAFHARHYHPCNSVLSLSGAIQPSQAFEISKRVFAGWAGSGTAAMPKIPPVGNWLGPKVLFVNSNGSQIQCRISFRALSFCHPEFYGLEGLCRILDSGSGSPLRRALQEEKGFCYSLGVGTDSYENAGAIHIDFTVQPDNLVGALEKTFEILFSMNDKFLDSALVRHMIEQYVKNRRFATTDLWEFSGKAGFQVLFPASRSMDEEIAKTQKLTIGKLKKVIQEVVRKNNLGITLVGPISKKIRKECNSLLANLEV